MAALRAAVANGRRIVEEEQDSDLNITYMPKPRKLKGFKARLDQLDKHIRKLHHGEITRYYKLCIQDYFGRQLARSKKKHLVMQINEFQFSVADHWLDRIREIAKDENIYISPARLLQILRTTVVNGSPFRIDGDLFQLLRSAEDSLYLETHIQPE